MTRTVVNPLVSSNIVVIDLMCDSRSYIPCRTTRPTGCIRTTPATRSSRRKSCKRDHVVVLSGAAEQLRGDDDRAVTHVSARQPMHGFRSDDRRATSSAALRQRAACRVPAAQALPGAASRAANGRTVSTAAQHPPRGGPAAGVSASTDVDAHIVLTVRADTLGRHGGQVSLPGGVVEPGETFEQAALREAHEEVGLCDGRRRVSSAR